MFYLALAFVSIDPMGCVCNYCVASQVEKVLRRTHLMPREGLISCITIINPNNKNQLQRRDGHLMVIQGLHLRLLNLYLRVSSTIWPLPKAKMIDNGLIWNPGVTAIV